MIETVSDLLEQLRDKGIKQILEKDADITHRPTIGNIYEGLTKDILSKAIFKNLNIRVVLNSFIYNDSGEISDEMDCMVVVGNGIKLSFTDQYKYHIANVIAVIQVKKKLFANDIDEAYLNLRSVKKIAEPRDAEEFVARLHTSAYEGLVSKRFPTRDRIERFSDRENIIYHFLLMEAFVPLRIVFGYFGYVDEFGLREGLVKKLEQKITAGPARGYSPGSLPNLIICGNNCIVKNNGMPLTIPLQQSEFYWPVLVSSNEKAIYYLLDLIWTRISFKFKIPASQLFNDDFKTGNIHAFLSAKEKKLGHNSWAWEYYYHEADRKKLAAHPLSTKDWMPAEVNDAEATLLFYISSHGAIPIGDDAIQRVAKENKLDQGDLLRSLIAKRLIYIDEDTADLLIEEVFVVTFGGKTYAGENKNGQMSKWLFERDGNSML